MTRAILIGIVILLLFAHGQIWLFTQIDRTIERSESRRYIALQDVKTKVVYQCYRSTRDARPSNRRGGNP